MSTTKDTTVMWVTRLNKTEDILMQKFKEWLVESKKIDNDTKYAVTKFCIMNMLQAFMMDFYPNYSHDIDELEDLIVFHQDIVDRAATRLKDITEVEEEIKKEHPPIELEDEEELDNGTDEEELDFEEEDELITENADED